MPLVLAPAELRLCIFDGAFPEEGLYGGLGQLLDRFTRLYEAQPSRTVFYGMLTDNTYCLGIRSMLTHNGTHKITVSHVLPLFDELRAKAGPGTELLYRLMVLSQQTYTPPQAPSNVTVIESCPGFPSNGSHVSCQIS